MSNILYEDKMYASDIKDQFLAEIESDAYQESYKRLFKISQSIETYLGKDLFDFTRDELRGFFYRTMPRTTKASKNNVFWVANYITWAIQQGYKKTNLNPLDTIETDWKEQFAQRQLKNYWTDEEIKKIANSRANYQDAATILLPFWGAYGTAGSEMLNLTRADIDNKKNELTLRNGENTEQSRTITVDESIIRLCFKALDEDVYQSKNGNPDKDAKKKSNPLLESEHVIRLAKTRVVNDRPDDTIIYRRVKKIAEEIDEPNFTFKNIVYSGMICMASKLYQENDKLDTEEFQIIKDQFGFDDNKLYRYKHEFLNIKTIKDIYDLA